MSVDTLLRSTDLEPDLIYAGQVLSIKEAPGRSRRTSRARSRTPRPLNRSFPAREEDMPYI